MCLLAYLIFPARLTSPRVVTTKIDKFSKMFWSVVSEAYVGPYIYNGAFLCPSYMFDRVWNTPKNFPNFLFNFLGFTGQYSCLIGLFLLKSFNSLIFNKSFLTRSFFTNKNILQKECLKIFCNSFRQSLLFINENSKLFSWLEKVINIRLLIGVILLHIQLENCPNVLNIEGSNFGVF